MRAGDFSVPAKDPKVAKINTLTTKVEQLEAQMNLTAHTTAQKLQSGKGYDNANNNNNSKYLTIDAWCMKKTEPMIQKEGKTWYWCPKHVSPCKYDELYATHKPEDHDEWVKNRNRFNRREKKDHEKKDENKKDYSDSNNEKSLSSSIEIYSSL